MTTVTPFTLPEASIYIGDAVTALSDLPDACVQCAILCDLNIDYLPLMLDRLEAVHV